MSPTTLERVALIAVIASIISCLLILIDIALGRRQKMGIMNLVWPMTALYFGPIGLWAYYVMGRPEAKADDRVSSRPRREAHQGHPKKPFWQIVFVATSHCGAGCTLGDCIGESAIFWMGFILFGSPLLTAYLVDFTLAYIFGIAFQFFTIVPMRNLGIKDGLLAAIKADTISLIAFEVGMFGWMALNRIVFFENPPEPNTASYWFLMQIAMIVGFATSYPANWWLVKSGFKEAM